jgi:4-hydroxy-tetrahydrodipicolinate synthase
MHGIIGVMNTPFTVDDSIDVESLKRYVWHSLDCGVVGFLVTAMAAEISKLSLKERERIVRTVVEEVQGRVPVIAGSSAPSAREREELARMGIQQGADGILVSIPYSDEKSYLDDVARINSLQPGFLMIQDWSFDKSGIPVPVIKKAFQEFDSFTCLKVEVAPAGKKYSDVLEATGGALHVSGGWAGSQMIEALDRGVHAFMPTILHDVYGAIYRLHKNGDRAAAKELFFRLLRIIAFSHQHLDISIHFNKLLVHRQGMFSTARVREPILPFDSYHQAVAEELVQLALSMSKPVKRRCDA